MAEASKTFKVGVIGYGLSAKVFHIPFIKATPTLELHSILQRSPKTGDSAPADHPELQHHTDLAAFLADPALDAAVLSTPPQTHFPFAKAALEAGKHVFVEKPFVPTAAEADQLIEFARARGRLICVYQNRRWDGEFLEARRLIAEGTLGRVVEFETHFDRYRAEKYTNWKGQLTLEQGGTALYDLGSHLVDQAYVLFGMPESVFAKFVAQRDGRFVNPASADTDETRALDGVSAQLFYADGLIVYVRIGVLSVETRQPRFRIRGTKGTYSKEGLDPQEGQLRSGMGLGDARFGREGAEWSGRLVTLGGGEDGKAMEERVWPCGEPPVTYLGIYEGFAAALASGREEDVPVPGAQARDVLRILEAMKESAGEGREVRL